MNKTNYVSGGRNPNWEKTCATCSLRVPSSEHEGWGWCAANDMASVSPTGGCDEHSGNPKEQAR